MAYVTGVSVIYGGQENIRSERGYHKIPVDLNLGARGEFIFLCYRRGNDINDAITQLQIVEGENALPPPGYTKINVDLNKGARGAYLYLCYTKSKSHRPITMLEVIQGGNPDIWPAESPDVVRIDMDCNKGARGKYVYVCYRPEKSK